MYLARRFQREYKYAGTQEAKRLNIRAAWGGNDEPSTTVIQPTPIAQPTAQGSAQDWAQALATIYETQGKYLPKFAQLSYDIQKQLYPSVAGLTESLGSQAVEGMKGNLPQDVEGYYSDKLKATFGRNLMNPQGQQAYGLGMTSFREQYKNYYQNLALLLLGLNPTVQSPSYDTMQSNMTAGNVMNANTQNYGTYASYMRPIVYPNYNQNQNSWVNTMGSVGAGLVGMGSLYSALNPRPVNFNYGGYLG